jgi:hypothetical protein
LLFRRNIFCSHLLSNFSALIQQSFVVDKGYDSIKKLVTQKFYKMKKTILLIAVAAAIHITRGYAQQLQPNSANHNKLTMVKDYLPLRDVSNRN